MQNGAHLQGGFRLLAQILVYRLKHKGPLGVLFPIGSELPTHGAVNGTCRFPGIYPKTKGPIGLLKFI